MISGFLPSFSSLAEPVAPQVTAPASPNIEQTNLNSKNAELPALDDAASPALPSSDAEPLLRAQVKAKESTQVASEMAGRINYLKIRDGERFKTGQLLVGFHCNQEAAQLAKAKATLDKKQKTHEIDKKLANLKSISVLELEVAKAEENEARAEVKVGQAVLEKCEIKAPFNGKVADVMARAYQSVRPGDPLLEIINENDLEVEFMAPSKSLPQLKPGAAFKVKLEETQKTYQAKILRLGGRVDPVSQTIKVYGRISDDLSDILPGMSGAIELNPTQ